MKKNLVRILALALVLFLALGIIPLGAFAAVNVGVSSEYYTNTQNPTVYDYYNNYIDYKDYPNKSGSSVTIKTSDYDSFVTIGGNYYDLKGIIDAAKTDWTKDTNKIVYTNSLTITDKNVSSYGSTIWLSYVPHQHALSRWYSDGTTHWRQCLVCHDNFMYQNWCQDGDGDQVCNICGGHVPYHDVTIIESEGGTITVNKDLACYRTKITADVEPAAGYRLEKLHFTKVRDDGSRQEVVRNEKGGQFWTLMPTYDMEVSAEFVKN